MNQNHFERYVEIAREVRTAILELTHRTKTPHIGPSFSIADILVALYFKYLNVDPYNYLNENRDRFILSKGHACPAFYSILFLRGFLSALEFRSIAINGGVLQQHPDRNYAKGIEISTGSLGHGLSVGTGMALAGKRDGRDYKVFVLLGDGELNEGSTWEAVMFAAHHKLDNLVAIVDHNRMQALGDTQDIIDLSPLHERWASFGWGAKEVGGHSFLELFNAFDSLPLSIGKPSVIVCKTTKGKGISFMENQLLWHYRAPDDKEYVEALEELSR